MVDETGQVSKEMLQQTQEILEFAAQKLGEKKTRMAVTFVKPMSVVMNLIWYRDTDRVRQIISHLSINQNWKLPLTEDLLENPELAER